MKVVVFAIGALFFNGPAPIFASRTDRKRIRQVGADHVSQGEQLTKLDSEQFEVELQMRLDH
jgi:hypothetical protein